MAIIGGEGSNVNTNFLDAYTKIAGQGRSAEEQVAAIRGSVDNKLVNAQEQVDNNGGKMQGSKIPGRRELTGLDRTAAELKTVGDQISTAAGNTIFGENQGDEDLLKTAGRVIADVPLGMVGMFPRIAGTVLSTQSGTSLDYYDPETATVPEGELGSNTALGTAAKMASAGTELAAFAAPIGAVGRAGAGIAKGAGRGAAKMVSSKFGNGTESTQKIGDAFLEGWQSGVGKKPLTPPTSKLGKARENLESFARKNAGSRALTSAAEEATQEVVQESLDWVASNDDSIGRGEVSADDWGDLSNSIGMAAYGGAVGGGFYGGLGGLNEQRLIKKAEKNIAKNNPFVTASEDSLSADSAVSRKNNAPWAYDSVEPSVHAEYTEDNKPKVIPGQSTVMTTSDEVGINNLEGGRVTLAAVYQQKGGKEHIDASLGATAAELNVDLNRALNNPEAYDNGTERGEEAAIKDLNKVLDAAGGASVIAWKDPANGQQVKLNFTKVLSGNQLRVNQAIAKMLNADFDTDLLSTSFSPEEVKSARYPTNLLNSNAVEGRVNLNLEYVAFGELDRAKINEDAFIASLVKTGLTEEKAKQTFEDFIKTYNGVGGDAAVQNEARAQALSNFLSREARNVDPVLAGQLFDHLQLRGTNVEHCIAAANVIITHQLKQAVNGGVDQVGTSPGRTAPREDQVLSGMYDPNNPNKSLRQAAAYLFPLAHDQGQSHFTTTAATRIALDFQNLTAIGTKPQDVLKQAYRMSVLGEFQRELQKTSGKITRETGLKGFVETVNRVRKQFEDSVRYTQLDGVHIFDGFVGSTDAIREEIGSIKAFEQICGSVEFSKLFTLPDMTDDQSSVWTNYTVSEVFSTVAKSKTGHVNAFSYYDEAFEKMMINGIKSTYKASVAKKYQQLVDGATEATKIELHPDENGLITAHEMPNFIDRFFFVSRALRQRMVNLGLYSVNSLSEKFDGFYEHGLLAKDPDTLLRMMAALAVHDECTDLRVAVDEYNRDASLNNADLVRDVALRQTQLLAPPYQLIAAEVLEQLDAGEQHIESGLYNMLSNLHRFTVKQDQLNALLERVYQTGDFTGSYGNLMIDLLVTSKDEISLGQLGEDFTQARVYSRRAARSDEELATLRLQEITDQAKELGDSPQYFVWVLQEMSKEPVLWDDEVMSEQLRASAYITNETKEKARASTFSKIVHAGLALNHGGYKTEEMHMFLDATWKLEADGFFNNASVLSDFIFGEKDFSYEVFSSDGTSRIVTKADFFKWGLGEDYIPGQEQQAEQIYTLIQKRKRLLSSLLPATLTTSIQETAKKVSATEAVKFYVQRREARNEVYVQQRNMKRLKEAIQENVSALEFVFYLMSEINNGEALPFTDAQKFFSLYQRAMRELVMRTYHNITAILNGSTTIGKSQAAKVNSSQNLIEIMGELFGSLLDEQEIYQANSRKVQDVMDQVAADGQISKAIETLFPRGGTILENLSIVDEFASASAGIESRLELRQDAIFMRMQFAAIAMQRFGGYTPASYGDVVSRLSSRIRNLTEAELIQFKDSQGYNNNWPNAAEDIRERMYKELGNYTEEKHTELAVNFLDSFQNEIRKNKLPPTFAELISKDDISQYFKEYNPNVGEGVNRTKMNNRLHQMKTEWETLIAKAVLDKETVNAERAAQRDLVIKREKAEAEAAYKKNPAAFKAERGSIGQAITEVSKRNEEFFAGEVMRDWAAIDASLVLKQKSLEDEYYDLATYNDSFAYYSMVKAVQRTGDPINPLALSDLDEVNQRYLDFCESLKDAFPVGEPLNELISKPYEMGAGEISLPQFRTLDPMIKAAIFEAQASLAGGDVEIGTALGAGLSGQRSVVAEIGQYQVCKAEGTAMSYKEATEADDVITIRVKTDTGTRVVPKKEGTQGIFNYMVRDVSDETEVVAFKKNECTCPGCCSNHDLNPTYNYKTKNNGLATFFKELAYFMEEVEQLQKKKALSSGAAAKSLFKEMEADEALRHQEFDGRDIVGIKEACLKYTAALKAGFAERIDTVMNKGKTGAQEMLAAPEVFSENLAEFCSRYVLINVLTSDGQKLSEYNLKNLGLEERLTELYAMTGVKAITVMPISMAPEQSFAATVRYSSNKKGKPADNNILGLQDEGAKIVQNEDASFSYTETVTYKPGQLNLDEYYNMSEIMRPGKTELPPGPGTKIPYVSFIQSQMGLSEIYGARRKRAEDDGSNIPMYANDITRERLEHIALSITKNDSYSLVNIDTSGSTPSEKWLTEIAAFRPTREDLSSTSFGKNALPIKPAPGKTAMVFLLHPDARMVRDYCEWAGNIPQKTHIFVQNEHRDSITDAGVGIKKTVDDFVVVEIDPVKSFESLAAGGFTAQTHQKESEFTIFAASERTGIGDGVVYLPPSHIGKPFLVVRESKMDLSKLMKDRIGEMTVVQDEDRGAVIAAYRRGAASPGHDFLLLPDEWVGAGPKPTEGFTEESISAAFDNYETREINEQGLATDLISDNEIVCVLALPPIAGDPTETTTYYPLTMAEIGLGSSADSIIAEPSSDGTGLNFTAFTYAKWTQDTVRKYLGEALKATIHVSDKPTMQALNGMEVGEAKRDDVIEKMLETGNTPIKKMMNFYQVPYNLGGRLLPRSMYYTVDEQGRPQRKPNINPNLGGESFDRAASTYEDTSLENAIVDGMPYKDPKSSDFNPAAEEVLRSFLSKVLQLGGKPKKLISPGIVENNELVAATFDDPIMSVYFSNIRENDIFLMLNYISDGEFCPPSTTEMSGRYAMNFDYKMAVLDNSPEGYTYKHFSLGDGTYHADNISIVDGVSKQVTKSMQQSVKKIVYANPSASDVVSIRNKQSLDAKQYDKLGPKDEAILNKLRQQKDRLQSPRPPVVRYIENIADCFEKSMGTITNDTFTKNLADATKSIYAAWEKPAEIHILDDNKNKQPAGEAEWRELEDIFARFSGFSGDNTWSKYRLKRFISARMAYTAQENGLDSFSFVEVKKMLIEYGERLDVTKKGKKGVLPRTKVVSQSGNASTARMDTCGSLGALQEEWTIPAVKELFNGDWKSFLTAVGEYQREQSKEYRGILGASPQKLKMYHYIQLALQFELNQYVPGGVGSVDMFDWSGNANKNANDILRMFGIEPTNAEIFELMQQSSTQAATAAMRRDVLDRGGYGVRGKQKTDKYGELLPQSAGHVQQHTKIGNIFNTVYSLTVANALALNPGLVGANITQIAINGQAQKFANRITFFSGGKFKNGIGVQPREIELIERAGSDSLLAEYYVLQQMLALYDDHTLLDNFFNDPDGTKAHIEEALKTGSKPQRLIRRYARFATQAASGFGLGMKAISKNHLFRMGQYMGDLEWLSKHYMVDGQNVVFTQPLMTQMEWEAILSDEIRLREFLAKITNPSDPMNALHNAALQDSLRITWARKNIVTELLSSIITGLGSSRFPASEDTLNGLMAVFVSPFIKYITSFAMVATTSVTALPCETLLHIAHYRGLDLKRWLRSNDIDVGLIDRIDFEAMTSSRSIQEALIRDAVRFGGVQFLGLVAAGLLQFAEPEGEELKDNPSEYSIGILKTESGEPFRFQLKWPLQDILGPWFPVAVYWSTVMSGNPRPGIIAEGMADLMSNSAVYTASNMMDFFADPLMWQRETNDEDLGIFNGENLTEEDPAITNGNKMYMQGVMALYRVMVPRSLDSFLNGAAGSENEVSSNYIYEEDDSGKPTGRINPDTGQYYLEKTDAEDAAWRRLSKNKPILGWILDLQNNFLGKGGTGYTRTAMPEIIRYSPFQVNSAKMYELNGDVVHDNQVAADVIAMLASYDDMDELMATGFYINADTRFFVGQKVWDAYYSYQDQIDQAYALGLNDAKALGGGDYITGSKIFAQWKQSMEAQKQFYYDFYYEKVNSSQLRTRMETANVIRQSYDKDSSGEYYATGFRNDNPWSFVAFASRLGNAGNEGGWSSIDPLVGLPVGERGWTWNKANSYYDSLAFEEFSSKKDGKGYSSVKVSGKEEPMTDLSALFSVYNPSASTKSSGYSSGYSRSGGGGGGGYSSGGGSGIPKLYSNTQDLNADRPTLARMGKLYDSQLDYIRPDWETKGSNKASRRSDI